MHNPIFQDTLICTSCASSKFTIIPYNKMRTNFLDKIKPSLEQNILRTVLDFVLTYQHYVYISKGYKVFGHDQNTSLKGKSNAYLFRLFNVVISWVVGPKYVTTICIDNASNYKGAGIMLQDKHANITWVLFIPLIYYWKTLVKWIFYNQYY